MAGERPGRRTSATPKHRRRLSDMTNLPLFSASLENFVPSSKDKELQKEIFTLTKMVSEKDATIAAQSDQILKQHREYTFNLHRRAAFNEEIIFHNTRLSKENLQLREQLKIVQHEHSLMTSMFKIMEAELRLKVEDMTHHLNMLLMEKQVQIVAKAPDASVKKQSKAASTRRYSMTTDQLLQDLDYNGPGSLGSLQVKDEPATSRRLSLRSRKAVGVKEVPLKDLPLCVPKTLAAKEGPPKDLQDLPSCVPKTIHNRYHQASGMVEAMERLCEGDECVSSPCATDGQSPEITCEVAASRWASDATEDAKPIVNTLKLGRARKSNPVAVVQMSAAQDCGCPPGSSDTRVATSYRTSQGVVRQAGPADLSRPAPESTGGGRPMRRATACIASYKEPPLNTKMRRPA